MFFLLFLLDDRSGSGKPKNIWILRIRIRNTATSTNTSKKDVQALREASSPPGNSSKCKNMKNIFTGMDTVVTSWNAWIRTRNNAFQTIKSNVFSKQFYTVPYQSTD
jgi:hypothetical protein